MVTRFFKNLGNMAAKQDLMHECYSRLWILPDIKAVLYLAQSALYLAYSHLSIVSVCACAVLKTFNSVITFIIL